MSDFWNMKTRLIKPYTPGEQPAHDQKVIKLNTNENPFPPSPKVIEAIIEKAGDNLRLYSDPDSKAAKAAFARANGLNQANVFAGNGSDEVLAIAFMTFFDASRPVNIPAVSYSFYPVYCNLFSIPFTKIDMIDGLALDVAAFCKARGGVVLANPNAPTSLAISLREIEDILLAHPHDVVLVDEAYVDFGGESAVSLIPQYKNLLVVKTLSKSYSLAGMRLGFAAGDSALIEGMERVKNSFNSYPLDTLAIAAAEAALDDRDYFEHTRAEVMRLRGVLTDGLRRLGFEVPDSKANFVFATHPKRGGAKLAQELKQSGILVRHFADPLIDKYLRISVGTESDTAALLAALERILK